MFVVSFCVVQSIELEKKFTDNGGYKASAY